jgi:hypothetical protein
MKRMMFAAAMSAAAASMTVVALAQTPAQSGSQPPSADRAPAKQEQQVTVVGCVTKEADYRSARDAGKGGAAGTGVGAGNEFVLTNAMQKASGSQGTAGTSGSADAAYEITGSNEGKLSAHVGKRVEIVGKLKAAETSASGRPTGGATAGQPPAGVDVASKDLKLRELEVSSVREVPGESCPAK